MAQVSWKGDCVVPRLPELRVHLRRDSERASTGRLPGRWQPARRRRVSPRVSALALV